MRQSKSQRQQTGAGIVNPLDHPICLASPKRLTTVKSWHEHIPFAMFLVDLIRPKIVVELGTHAGDSYCAFCQAVKELHLDTRCYAVDTWQGDPHSGFYDATVLDDLRAHHDPLYGSFSRLIPSTFDDALPHFSDGTISLLHIDGYHSYEAVSHDFESWLPKMSEYGVVLLHDTNVREHDFGIGRFWDEIKQRYLHFEFLHGHGLGMVAVGKTRSKHLQAILRASQDDAATIRSFFFHLGQKLTLRDETEEMQRALEETRNQLAAGKQLEQQLAEQLKHQQEHRTTNMLQLFWDQGGGFAEEHSLEEPLAIDDPASSHVLRLPAGARGPLRLDPGDRPGYVEIHRIELYAGSEGVDFGPQLIASWSAADDFAGLTGASGIVRLTGSDTYRFLCMDGDPQLLLTGVPERNDARQWRLEVAICTSDRFQDILSSEIRQLERESTSRQEQLRERDAALASAQAGLAATMQLLAAQDAEQQEVAQALETRLAEQERASKASQAQWDSVRSHLSGQLAEKEKELLSRSADLSDALEKNESLRSQLAHLREAFEAFQTEIAEREQTAKELQARLDAEREQLVSQATEQEAARRGIAARLSAMDQKAQSLAAELAEKDASCQTLRTEVESKVKLAEALRDEIAVQETAYRELEARLGVLTRDVAEKEYAIQLLASESERRECDLRDKERQIQERTSQLQESEKQLQQITQSLGWRLLSRYGHIKHRFLLPGYHWMRQALEVLLRREYQPAIQPIHQLRPLDAPESWESTGRDPQFNLTGEWPSGWAEVSIDIRPGSPVSGRARLYVDRGAGYSEADSYDLGQVGAERRSYVRLGSEVVGLRFDPFESASPFRIHKLSVKRVTARRARNENGSKEDFLRSSYLKQFAQFSRARVATFRRENGRGPRLRELPAAVHRTWRAWNDRQELGAPPMLEAQPSTAIAPKTFSLPPPTDPYDAWLEVNQWNARRESLLCERLSTISEPPLLSVVMPVYNPPPEFLDKAIRSVVNQVYPNWELCIADDSSTDPAIREILQQWTEREPRIRVAFREKNGHISRATNSASELARGSYLVFMDQDDEITPDALGEVALHLADHPETDVLYTDDDKINSQGQRFAPRFKPDWSPELLLSSMYMGNFLVLRRSLYFEAGGIRADYEGSQNYNLALRATEIAHRVGHIPKLLYHRRAWASSATPSGRAKPEPVESAKQAVQDAVDRRGVRAKAYQPDWAVKSDNGIFGLEFPDDGPRIAIIIILTRNNVAALIACIESLEKTTYRNYEVVIVDNESDEPATMEFLRRACHRVLRIPNPGGRFNVAALNNRAAEQVDADFVLFLHDDMEVVAPEWLSQMAGYLATPGVGAAGARLRFPDGTIRHAGIVHGYYNGMAGPAFKSLPAASHGYLSYSMVARNCSAVTAACLLTWRDLFLSMGGFDEQTFGVAYTDVDYCYRLREAGHRVVYCPAAELIDHDGYSQGFEDNPAEPAAFRRKYGEVRDPFYNPNLSLAHERFEVDARTLAPDTLKPIHVVMCAFTLNREGAPHSQFELTTRLKETGVIDPIVYCPQEGPLRAAYEEHGIRVDVFSHPLAGVYDLPAYERAIQNFADRIEDWNVDLVYANTRQTFYAIEAAKQLGLPSIWNPRESEPWQTYFDYLGSELAARALQCFFYPYRVIFVADATRESCSQLNVHYNFTTIHNGLDRERLARALDGRPRVAARNELNIASDEITILLMGTVCERKGQMDIVQAVAQLSERAATNLRCFIVGDRGSDYADELRSAIKSLPLSRQSKITLVPETSDAAMYYTAADVFVCTSRIESFPRVILEAMAAGLPIITTPIYGIAEQVQENINALFYQPGDSGTLSGHIERLLREPRLRQRLAGNSRNVLDTLTSFDAMVSAYGSVFREAWLSGRSR